MQNTQAIYKDNGTTYLKKCKKNYLNTNIYSYLETSGGQSHYTVSPCRD